MISKGYFPYLFISDLKLRKKRDGYTRTWSSKMEVLVKNLSPKTERS